MLRTISVAGIKMFRAHFSQLNMLISTIVSTAVTPTAAITAQVGGENVSTCPNFEELVDNRFA